MKNLHQPVGSKIRLNKTNYKLIVDIPPGGLQGDMIPFGRFCAIWLGIVFLSTAGAIVVGDTFLARQLILFWLVGFSMVGGLFYFAARRFYLEIDRKKFRLEWKFLDWSRMVEGNTADIEKVEVSNSNVKVNGKPVTTCALIEGVRTHRFGSMLTQVEKEWLMAEISDFLESQNI